LLGGISNGERNKKMTARHLILNRKEPKLQGANRLGRCPVEILLRKVHWRARGEGGRKNGEGQTHGESQKRHPRVRVRTRETRLAYGKVSKENEKGPVPETQRDRKKLEKTGAFSLKRSIASKNLRKTTSVSQGEKVIGGGGSGNQKEEIKADEKIQT